MSNTGFKGLPANPETAPKREGFRRTKDWALVLAAVAVNPREEIFAPYSYPAFDNDVRDLFVPNHLIDLRSREVDRPCEVSNAIKQRFNMACESSH